MNGRFVHGFLLNILKAGDFPSVEGVTFNSSSAR